MSKNNMPKSHGTVLLKRPRHANVIFGFSHNNRLYLVGDLQNNCDILDIFMCLLYVLNILSAIAHAQIKTFFFLLPESAKALNFN
jgi:hypothetical protein